MPFKSFMVAWLHIILLHNSNALLEERPRKSCPSTIPEETPLSRADTSDRIKKLRDAMFGPNMPKGSVIYDAYIITPYDDHLNEFVDDRDKRLEYITGYTGRGGLAVVTRTKLAFWIDELHYERADNELSCSWTLFKTNMSTSPVVALAEWVFHELSPNNRVGFDTKTISNSDWETISRMMSTPTKSIIFGSPSTTNLVDSIWPDDERPRYAEYLPYVWPEKYAGKSWKDKLSLLREQMKSLDVDAMVVTSLSEVAWLLNIRGRALPYGPFVKAFVVVSKDQLHLFINMNLTQPIRGHLYTDSCSSMNCARLHEYETIYNDFRKISGQWKKILLPTMSIFGNGASRQISWQVNQDRRKLIPSPLIDMMAEKDKDEIERTRAAHIRDAIMFCNFSVSLEIEIQRSTESWQELSLVNRTYQYRSSVSLFKGLSYQTRVAVGPNTAIFDYIPTEKTNIPFERNQLLIIDSGSHYLDGTTALARTLLVDYSDLIPAEYIEWYTRIMIGLINFAMLIFPSSVTTSQLDVIPRIYIWQMGEDYPHGSAHGIGIFSSVYEAPIDIDYKNGVNDTLKVGNLILVEVGAYLPSHSFGMKVSLVLEVVQNSPGYLKFLPVTMFPFESRMINITWLNIQQKEWLNNYNQAIRESVAVQLRNMNNANNANNAYNWLMERTEQIPFEVAKENDGATTLAVNAYLSYLLIINFIFRFIMSNRCSCFKIL